MTGNVEMFLLRLGIRTYSYPVITQFNPSGAPPAGQIEVQIGDSLSTELGWIYGISTEVDGVTPKDKNVPLPTMAQAANLYLNLQNAQTWYINDFRFTNMVYYNPLTGTPIPSGARYYPVNIPMQTDLKQSIIRNPLQQFGFSTMITFHYIPRATYNQLVADGIMKTNIDKGINS